MFYLYAKDKNYLEYCERFKTEDDVREYCYQNIPGDPKQVIAGMVYPDAPPGMWDADENSSYDKKELAACFEDAEAKRYMHPYWIINLGESNYIAYQDKSEVDWVDLYFRWVDRSIYIIPPYLFVPGDLVEAAQRTGMAKLVRFVLQDEESEAAE